MRQPDRLPRLSANATLEPSAYATVSSSWVVEHRAAFGGDLRPQSYLRKEQKDEGPRAARLGFQFANDSSALGWFGCRRGPAQSPV
jgi:hypothetical protein